jgi:hypothetical protein
LSQCKKFSYLCNLHQIAGCWLLVVHMTCCISNHCIFFFLVSFNMFHILYILSFSFPLIHIKFIIENYSVNYLTTLYLHPLIRIKFVIENCSVNYLTTLYLHRQVFITCPQTRVHYILISSITYLKHTSFIFKFFSGRIQIKERLWG